MGTPSAEEIKASVAGVFDRAAATYDQVGVDFFQPIGRFLVSRTDPNRASVCWTSAAAAVPVRSRLQRP
jgi:hypothetical protein